MRFAPSVGLSKLLMTGLAGWMPLIKLPKYHKPSSLAMPITTTSYNTKA